MSIRGKLTVLILSVSIAFATALPVAANPDVPPAGPVHVVSSGETLLGIAMQYGVSVESLQQANGIVDSNRIMIGQRLVIPTAGPEADSGRSPADSARFTATHVVAGGETLSRIAARYGTTSSELAEANGIADPNQLFVGQRLLVPGDAGAAVRVGFDDQALPSPFAAVEMRSAEPVQGDTVLIRVETMGDAVVTGSFEGQGVMFLSAGNLHWGLIPIHPMAGLGPYDVWIKAAVAGQQPTSIVGQLWVTAGDFEVEDITLPADKTNLLDRELIIAEREKLTEALETTDAAALWRGLFTYPIADPVISSEFGTRRSYNGGPASSYHEGLDFDASAGDAVIAVADGKVVLAEQLTVRGNAVLIDHGLGVHTGYWHMSAIDVEPGQEVHAGDMIGRVGSSGLSTGPHLHWEVRIGEINVNPKQWTRELFP